MQTNVQTQTHSTIYDYDRNSHYSLMAGEFVCPFDGAVMDFRGGLFANADSHEAAQIERLECPCCHHSMDTNFPAYELQHTDRMSREYVIRRAAAKRVDEMFDLIYAELEADELYRWWEQAAEYEAYVNGQQAALVDEYLAELDADEALAVKLFEAVEIKRQSKRGFWARLLGR